jgi:hypothetical protein
MLMANRGYSRACSANLDGRLRKNGLPLLTIYPQNTSKLMANSY